MANKVIGDYTAAVTIDGANHYMLIQPGGSSTPYNKINRNTLLNITSDPVGISDTQTISNKTLGNSNIFTIRDDRLTLQDNADTTKQLQFQLSGITTATTRTLTVPDANTTLVGTDATQTLTNKTLTSPTISGGTISNPTLTVDSISGFTTPTVVTAGGVQLNNGTIGTANAVTSNSIAASAVVPNKLQTGTGTGWTWSNYVPTFTNLTQGSSPTLTARYIQTGKTVVYQGALTLGVGGSVSGAVTISLPVNTNASYVANNVLGNCELVQTGTASFPGIMIWTTASTITVLASSAGGTYTTDVNLSTTVPFTWAATHRLTWSVVYEAA